MPKDTIFAVYEDIPKDLYGIWKSQMSKQKAAKKGSKCFLCSCLLARHTVLSQKDGGSHLHHIPFPLCLWLVWSLLNKPITN